MVALAPHNSLFSSSSVTKSVIFSDSRHSDVSMSERVETASVSEFIETMSSSSSKSSQFSPSPSAFSSLSRRLRNLDSLPDSLQEVYDIFLHLSTVDLRRRYGTEVITLIEISQETLTKAKLSLWKFSPCPIFFRPHKKAYFDLLELLEARGSCFKVSLQERWKRLVFHLSEDFEINLESSTHTWPCPSEVPQRKRHRLSDTHGTAAECHGVSASAVCDSRLMPPPSAFPPSEGVSSLSLVPAKKKGKPLDLHEFFPEVALADSCMRRIRRPMTQRFGIYCTGKTSMFQPLGHARGRPLSRRSRSR